MAWSPRSTWTFPRAPIAGLCIVLASSAAWAAGFPPFTQRDSITVNQGGSASVLDSGEKSVLANDFDFEGDPMTAIIDRLPRHGTVTLNPDGTFVYTHDGGDDDDDRFHYRASDGTGVSRRTRVSIEILENEEPVPPTITGQRNLSVREDGSITIRLSDLEVSDPDNDYPDDFTLTVQNGQNYQRSGTTISPDENFNGTLSIPVRVNDGVFNSNVFQLEVDVTPVNDDPFVTGQVEAQVAQEGEPFSLELSGFFDDIDSNTLRFSASGLPPSGNLAIGRNSGRISGTPVAVDARDDPYTVVVTASDGAGGSVDLEFPLTVFPIDRADLKLTALVTPQPAGPADRPSWTFSVENLGPADLTEGALSVQWFSSAPLVALEVPVSCSIDEDNTTSPSMTCSLANLSAGSILDVEVTSSVDAPGDINAIAEVTGNDPAPDNNIVSTSVNVAAAFTEGPAQIIDQVVTSFSVADLDEDGYQDILVAAAEVAVFWNTGARSIDNQPSVLEGIASASVINAMDWDRDGLLDIVVGGLDESTVFLNEGSRSFVLGSSFPGPQSRAVAAGLVADLSGDGASRWAVTGANGTAVFGPDGEGGVSRITVDSLPGRDIAVGDVDQDGFLDLIVTTAASREVRILANDGAGRFTLREILNEGSVASVTTADVTQDGLTDLLLAVDGADLEVPVSRILANDLVAGFSQLDAIGASPTAKLLDGDVDGDTEPDVVAVKQTGVHQLYQGDSVEGFALSDEQIVSSDTSSGTLVDINADGSLDLILAGVDSQSIEVHFNDGLGRFGLGDVEAPAIALNGAANVSIEAGEAYRDQGATAEDNIDGDLSEQIVVDNPVDSAVVGTYTVSYSVSDRAGNLGQAQRTVRVEAVTGVGGGGGGHMQWWWLLGLILVRMVRRGR